MVVRISTMVDCRRFRAFDRGHLAVNYASNFSQQC
jgi:hypothetical protein